ncbi:hypothetical protein RND15_52370, partial [Streptomyces sp. DSM 41529]|nr:hypothetical protein [Streptomyces sp. DSM 41529]
MTEQARRVLWLLTGLSGVAAVVLGVAAFVVNQDTAAQMAGVASAIASLLAVSVGCYTLLRTSAVDSQRTTAAGARSVASGGGIGRAVT